ncbi:MBL fold metallo-hydrolase [Candidatus Parcubacteria bacterium]|jgi:competence protein ComEC|nr:MAG: MBL fold metallo-hydrolase [Candidatus Parcubacteria bacterium]
MSNRFLISKKFALSLIGFLVLSLGIWFWQSRADQTLRVWFADVGQGDGIIIRTPSQETIIIDGGPSQKFVEQVDAKLPLTDRNVDLLVATHLDADHITGLLALLKTGRVKRVLMTEAFSDSALSKNFLAEIAAKNLPVINGAQGLEIFFGQVRAKILWPPKDFSFDPKNLNLGSIVLELSYGEVDFLFTGDAPDKVESRLVDANQLRPVEVLKVGHHGSKSSTSEEFLNATKPQYTILSVGAKNRYGHPAPSVLERLQKSNAEIHRTDLEGEILAQSTKERLIIISHK